ncbi:MAG: phosphoenolpyruvate--protein phosphotransferase [Lentisphaeria bacterium]|nr:phosphoenolpyruvate--protein phosphotransferase [Lentisphaeria bacterium]
MVQLDTQEAIYNVIPVSPGIAIGKTLFVASAGELHQNIAKNTIAADAVESELAKLYGTVEKTKENIRKLGNELKEKLDGSQATIFDAHLMMISDKSLLGEAEKGIRNELKNAAWAFADAAEKYASVMDAMPDPYLSERASDIRDVAKRFLAVFYNTGDSAINDQVSDRRIIIANELTPSETAKFDKKKILGFAVVKGSATSHTAILARSMQIPAVVNIPEELNNLAGDTAVIIDGFAGRLIVNPKPRTLEAYRLKAAEANKIYSRLLQDKKLVAETTDGFVVQLAINLEDAADGSKLSEYGAEAVGLFRTELLFMGRNTLPDEEEQFELYKNLLTSVEGRMVVVRTLDVGGDKNSTLIYKSNEENPFLGLRGIRLCLQERRDIFRTQLRALLRAGIYGNLKIMLPMLSSVIEVHETRALIAEIQAELQAENIEHLRKVSLGGMVETPVCALMVEHFAAILDFLSIGTNDLVQYTMSIDRVNEKVSYLYQPASPAVLELIHRTVKAAKRNNIWVSVCGEMAGDPMYTPLLLGLGVNELSMEPNSLNAVRRVVRSLSMSDAENMCIKAMNCTRSKEVRALTMELLKKSAPEVAELLLMQQSE